MIITCPECATRFVVDPRALGTEGRRVRCASCKATWFQSPQEEPPAPVDFTAADARAPDNERQPQEEPEETRLPDPDSQPAPAQAAAEVANAASAAPEAETAAVEAQPDAQPQDRFEQAFDSALQDFETATAEDPSDPPAPADDMGALAGVGEPANDETAEPPIDAPSPVLPGDPEAEDAIAIMRARRAERRRRRQRSAPDSVPNLPALPGQGGRMAITAGWLGLAFLMVASLSAVFFARESISEAWPPAQRLYAMFGGGGSAPVKLPASLGEAVTIVTPPPPPAFFRNGILVQEVTGRLENRSEVALKLPQMEGVIKDGDGRQLLTWTFEPPVAALQPGRSKSYNTEVVDLPRTAAELEIRFVSAEVVLASP